MKRIGFRKPTYEEYKLMLNSKLADKPLMEARLYITKPKKRKTKLRVAGHSTASELKCDIQALLREICILRDKKCILHGLRCHHVVGQDDVVWQAEHLIERSNAATYADSRLVVLVCKNCHGWKHFTKSNHDQYDKWVKSVLPKERVALWETMAESKWKPVKTGAYDWKLAKIILEQELRHLKANED